MKLIKFLTVLLLSALFQINAYAQDAGTGGSLANSLNSGRTSSTTVGNSTGSTQINGSSVNMLTTSIGNTGNVNLSPTELNVNINTGGGGTYTGNSYLDMTVNAIDIGTGGRATMASGPVNPSGGVNGTSLVTVTPTSATVVSSGNSSYTALAWGPAGASLPGDYTNYLKADQSGVSIGSATNLSLNAATTTLTSTTATNINTSGNASTSIGSSGTGAVTLTSGTNSMLINNSGTTITGTTATNGISNTGSFTSTGNATIGSGSSSSVTVGNATGNSTISMNGNRIQNVGNGTSAGDAVNYGQLTAVSNNVNSLNNSVNNLSNQLQQSQNQYRSGIAGVAAMNGIGALNGNQRVNFGMGVGSFAGNGGIAAGGNVRVTDNISLKAAVAQASNNTAVSAGFTVGF